MKRLKTITNAPSLANKVAWLLAVVLVGAIGDAGAAPAAGTAPWAEGDRSVHDPSRIVRCEGRYWLFATGMGISSRHSADTVTWEPGPRVFTNAPAWTAEAVPGFRGHFWAPDVIHLNGRYLLYYSVSTWGSQVSAIGLATNATLNPADPAFGWVDCGVVVQSRRGDDFNAIDPAVMLASDGRLWLYLDRSGAESSWLSSIRRRARGWTQIRRRSGWLGRMKLRRPRCINGTATTICF